MYADLIIQSYGGILDLNKCKGEIGAFLGEVNKHLTKILENFFLIQDGLNTKTLGKKVTLYILNTSEKVSFVVENDDSFCIALGAGIPLVLFDVFLIIMSHPKFFQEIGDIGQETEWQDPPPPFYFSRCSQLFENPANDLRISGFWRFPNELSRISFAFRMCYDALEFLLYHEFAHLFRGHLAYSLSLFGHSEIVEILETSVNHKKNNKFSELEAKQFLELDADRLAAELAFYPLIPRDSQFPQVDLTELNRRAFAVTVFMLTQHRSIPFEEYRRSKYSHPIVRHRLQMNWMFLSAIGELEIKKEMAIEIFSEFFLNLGLFSNLLGSSISLGTPYTPEQVEEEVRNRKEFYYQYLQKHSAELGFNKGTWRKNH